MFRLLYILRLVFLRKLGECPDVHRFYPPSLTVGNFTQHPLRFNFFALSPKTFNMYCQALTDSETPEAQARKADMFPSKL